MEGERLRVNGPREALTDELVQRIREQKALLLQLLGDTRAQEHASREHSSGVASSVLAVTQQGPWLLQTRYPESTAYNVAYAYDVEGSLDVGSLSLALQAVVNRHDALRTRFVVGSEVAQRFEPNVGLCLNVVDLSGLSQPRASHLLDELLRVNSRRRFELGHPPLFIATVFRYGADHHVLLLCSHHLVCDGWSMSRILEEVGEDYRTLAAGSGVRRGRAGVQVADRVRQENEPSQRARRAQNLAYWQSVFGDAPPPTALPGDRIPPAPGQFTARRLDRELPNDTLILLQQRARELGVTDFVLEFAAFAADLARLVPANEVTVGAPFVNRNLDTYHLVGQWVNVLPVRIPFEGSVSFADLVRVTHRACGEAMDHQDVSLGELTGKLAAQRSVYPGPLFSISFMQQESGRHDLDLRGAVVRRKRLEPPGAIFDFTLSVDHHARGGTVSAYYADELISEQLATAVLDRYCDTLRRVASKPQIDLRALGNDEPARQLLAEWGNGASPRSADTLAAPPDAIAVVEGEQHLSWTALEQQASVLAQRLTELGVGAETSVAVLLPKGTALVVAAAAIRQLGAAYAPLDCEQPPKRLKELVQQLRPSCIVVAPGALTETMATSPFPVVALTLPLVGEPPQVGAAPVEYPEQLAYVIFTSGSSGVPRPVGVTVRGLRNLLAWHRRVYDKGNRERVGLTANPGFDASVWELFAALDGRSTICVSPDMARVGARALGDWIERQALESCFLPTPLAEMLLDSNCRAALASLRYLRVGGDKLQRTAVGAFPRLYNHYGPTECSVVAAWTPTPLVSDLHPEPPLGCPVDGIQIWLLDESMQPVAPGAIGELCLAGEGLARGYLGAPGLTASHWVPHPWGRSPGERLYRTGDMARWMFDGQLVFEGRRDRQLKLRGMRVDPTEVERVMVQCDGVSRAAVVAIQIPAGLVLRAYFIGSARPEALGAFVSARLPAHMVPSLFAAVANFPITARGKVDYRALRQVRTQRTNVSPELEPKTETERAVADIWKELLACEAVKLTDNFIALGGYSLLVVKLQQRLQEVLQLHLPIATLFQFTDLEALCQHIDDQVRGGQSGGPEHASSAPGPTPDPGAQEPDSRASLQRQARERRRHLRELGNRG